MSLEECGKLRVAGAEVFSRKKEVVSVQSRLCAILHCRSFVVARSAKNVYEGSDQSIAAVARICPSDERRI